MLAEHEACGAYTVQGRNALKDCLLFVNPAQRLKLSVVGELTHSYGNKYTPHCNFLR